MTQPFGSYPGWGLEQQAFAEPNPLNLNNLVTQFLLVVHLGNSRWIFCLSVNFELMSHFGQRKCSRKTAVSQPKRNNWPEKYSERYQYWSLCSNCSLLLRYFLLIPQVSALIRKRTSNDTSLTTSAENFHLLSPKPDSFCYNSSEKQDLPWLHQVFPGLLEGFPSLIWHSRDPTK